MRTTTALCAALLLAAPLAAAEPTDVLTEIEAKARAARVRDVSYDIHLTFAKDAKTYLGETGLSFTLDAATADLKVNFRSGQLKKVLVNGQAVERPAFDGVALALPARLLKAGPNKVTVGYENAYDGSGSGVHWFSDPLDKHEYIFTDFEPFDAHRMFPCFDQPDLKAVYRVKVTAPKGWEVVGNAPTVRSAPDGDAITHELEPTPPFSTYLVFVGAGPFAKFTDAKSKIPSRIYARQSMKAYVNAGDIFDTTRRGLAFYPEFFGTPYPFKKYDQLFVPEFNSGAMENCGAVTFNERYLHRHKPSRTDLEARAGTILHEMAHMWFGDLVTMRWWDGLWLNESFATYMACVAEEKATGYTEAFEVFLIEDKGKAYWHDQLPTTHPVAGDVADTDTAFSNFDGITYGKGASLLKQLAFLIGEKAFREGLAAYFREHSWKNTELKDFMGAMARASGRDLTEFSELHLKTAGPNTVRAKLEEKAGKLTAFWLEQEPDKSAGKLRPQKLEVAAYHLDPGFRLRRARTAVVELKGARTRVPELEGVQPYAFVWPNHRDFAYVRVTLDPRSQEYVLAHLSKIPDGITRRGVWLSLWEMVRDVKLPPQKFLEAFIQHAPAEPDPMIVDGIHDRVIHVLAHYVKADHDVWCEKLFAVSWKMLERAAPGSDGQKTWFDMAVVTAAAPASLTKLAELVDGKRALAGLELDPEKRWDLTLRLAARGAPDAKARIAAELKRDPTDIGQHHALEAEAALPDAASKEAVFTRIVEDRKSSLDQLKALMNGFTQPHQSALTAPFVDRFFAALPALKERNEPHLSEKFVERMYPHYVFEPSVLAKTEAFLASHPALGDDLKKPLKNGADDIRRALAIFAVKPTKAGK